MSNIRDEFEQDMDKKKRNFTFMSKLKKSKLLL